MNSVGTERYGFRLLYLPQFNIMKENEMFGQETYTLTVFNTATGVVARTIKNVLVCDVKGENFLVLSTEDGNCQIFPILNGQEVKLVKNESR